MKKLSTGHNARVLRVGTRAGYAAHTLHRVAFACGDQVVHVEDFETQWNGPHPDPGSRMLRILERYVTHMSSKGLSPEEHWTDEPDTHGNLAHASMAPFQPVKP
jgi:hypothetical protein